MYTNINRSIISVQSVDFFGTKFEAYSARDVLLVRPVLYLEYNIQIIDGNGSKASPYILN